MAWVILLVFPSVVAKGSAGVSSGDQLGVPTRRICWAECLDQAGPPCTQPVKLCFCRSASIRCVYLRQILARGSTAGGQEIAVLFLTWIHLRQSAADKAIGRKRMQPGLLVDAR